MYKLTVCLAFLAMAGYVYGGTGTDAKALRTELFTTRGYDKKVRPRNNQSELININVSITIISINELSETDEALKVTAFLTISWIDEFMVWNASDYGNMTYYQYPQVDIWKPDIALKNSFVDYKELGVDTLNVELYADGTVFWYPFQVFQSTCAIDITYYPFDTQTCKLRFLAWSYTEYEVDIASQHGVELYNYEPHPIWDLVDTDAESVTDSGTVPAVDFTVTLKRKPMYFILSIVMPTVLLGILNIFVFALPCESGERAGYAITVFLAFAVFLTIVTAELPKNSNSVAVFAVFIIIQTVISTLITLIGLIMIRCSLFDDTVPVPKSLQTTLRVLTLKRWCLKKRGGSVAPNKHEKKSEVITLEQVDDHNDQGMGFTNPGLGDDGRSMSESDQEEYTWKEAMHELDKILFVLFMVIFLMSMIICFAVAATG